MRGRGADLADHVRRVVDDPKLAKVWHAAAPEAHAQVLVDQAGSAYRSGALSVLAATEEHVEQEFYASAMLDYAHHHSIGSDDVHPAALAALASSLAFDREDAAEGLVLRTFVILAVLEGRARDGWT
ncbi:hypothetical protein [Planobispora rosea]|uniref:hypothetical protein n=1 Tax=Planobispora rosea TaxID=35762 RepID=UPI001670DDC3|nr:hypothetical protein [Planobispora rosea]